MPEAYAIDGNLRGNHERYRFPKGFDCGIELINRYFRDGLKRSLRSQNVAGIGAVSPTGAVVGFCTLALCSLDRRRVADHLDQASVPAQVSAIRLVMLGVDRTCQGQGIGRRLLRKMFLQALRVHGEIPIKGIYLDGAPGAVAFYQQLGFAVLQPPDSQGSTPMFLPIQALLKTL